MSTQRKLRTFLRTTLLALPIVLGGCHVYESFTVTDPDKRITAYFCFLNADPEVPNITARLFGTLKEQAAGKIGVPVGQISYAEGSYTKKELPQLSGSGTWFCYQFFKVSTGNE